MLEHPEIGWMERTGYPSWMQEKPCRREAAAREEEKSAVRDTVTEVTRQWLRQLEGLTLERAGVMLVDSRGQKLDSQDLKRLLSAAKDLRELCNDLPGEESGIRVKLEGALAEYAL